MQMAELYATHQNVFSVCYAQMPVFFLNQV